MDSTSQNEPSASIDSILSFQKILNKKLDDLESSSKNDQKVDCVFYKVMNRDKTYYERKLAYFNCLRMFDHQDIVDINKIVENLDELSKKHSKPHSNDKQQEQKEIEFLKKNIEFILKKIWHKFKNEDETLKLHPFKKDKESPDTLLSFFHNKLKHNILEKRLCKLEALELFLKSGLDEA